MRAACPEYLAPTKSQISRLYSDFIQFAQGTLNKPYERELIRHYKLMTLNAEEVSACGKAVDLYSGDYIFESRLGLRISRMRIFMVFPCPLRANSGIVP
jgi:hypothetical protein